MIKMFHLTLLGWINMYNTLVIPASDNQPELVNLSFYKIFVKLLILSNGASLKEAFPLSEIIVAGHPW